MSSITITHPPDFVPTRGIPFKVQAKQGDQKRNRNRKVSGSSSDASSIDELAPKSIRMGKAAFHAALAEAQARPVVKNPQVLTTEDLKYGYYSQDEVRKATYTTPPAPIPAPLTKPFSSVAKTATTPPPPDFMSRSPSPMSQSVLSISTADFPTLAVSSASAATKAPVAAVTIKLPSTTTKTTNDNSSSWNTVARKTTKTNNSMQVPVKEDVGVPKSVPIPRPASQTVNKVVVPEKKQAAKIDSSLSGPEVAEPAVANLPNGKHAWVEVSSKKQNTGKKSPVSTDPVKPLNNKFEALLSVPKSKAPSAPASKKNVQTASSVEKPEALRKASGDSFGTSSSSKKKSRAQRKKDKKARSQKAKTPEDSASPVTETKSTAYRLASNSLSAVTILAFPTKVPTVSQQDTKPVSESKPTVSSSSKSVEVKDTKIVSPVLPATIAPQVVKSRDIKVAEVVSTPEVKKDIVIVTEINNEVDTPTVPAIPQKDLTQVREPAPLMQEAYTHSTLESRMTLCHGSDDFDEEIEVARIEEFYDYSTMESRFGLHHGFDEFNDEVEILPRAEEAHQYTVMESRFGLHHGSDDLDDELEIVRIEEPHDYSTMESRFALHHGSDDFDEEIEVNIALPNEQPPNHPTTESRFDLQRGSNDSNNNNVSKTTTTHQVHNTTISKPVQRTKPHKKATKPHASTIQASSTKKTPPSPPTQNPTFIRLGLTALSIFTTQLLTLYPSTCKFTPLQLTTLFSSFAAFERTFHNHNHGGIPSAEDILASSTLQSQIKLGGTSLKDFLGRIEWRDGMAGLGGICMAFEMAAEEEVGKGGAVGGVARWL